MSSSGQNIVFMDHDMKAQVDIPTKLRGVRFVIHLVAFGLFLASVTVHGFYLASFVHIAVHTSTVPFVDSLGLSSVTTLDEARTFLNTTLPDSINQFSGRTSMLFMNYSMMLHPMRIRSLRTATSGYPTLTFPDTGEEIRYSTAVDMCMGCPLTIPGAWTNDVFGMEGYVLYYINGSAFIDFHDSKLTTPMLMEKYVTDDTWAIFVDLTFYSWQYKTFHTLIIQIEFLDSGGIMATSSTYQMLNLQKLDVIASIALYYLLFYTFTRIANHVYHLVRLHFASNDCMYCRINKQRDETLLVTKCLSCAVAVRQSALAQKCKSCNATIPGLVHVCWRGILLNIWYPLEVASIGLVIYSCVLHLQLVKLDKDLMTGIETAVSSRGVLRDPVMMNSFALMWTSVSRMFDLVALNLVVTYLCTYRYFRSTEATSRFFVLLSNGLKNFLAFTFTFAVIFIGFVVCFHILFGSKSRSFYTVFQSILSCFRILVGALEYSELTDVDTFPNFILYPLFSWICIVIMLNVFVAIITHAYDEATLQVVYDVDKESLLLLLEPVSNLIDSLREQLPEMRTDPVSSPSSPKSVLDPRVLEELTRGKVTEEEFRKHIDTVTSKVSVAGHRIDSLTFSVAELAEATTESLVLLRHELDAIITTTKELNRVKKARNVDDL